ncbi:MAG: PQQ-dependent sugar dehydrogenase [Gaiellaceae bacterium]
MRSAIVVLAACAALTACSSGSPGVDTVPPGTTAGETDGLVRVTLRAIATGLDAPVGISSTPSEPERLYIVEQPGRVRVLEQGKLAAQPFLDIQEQVQSGGEQGLLSLAFHPDYASNGLFYVNYTDLQGDTRVVEYEAGAGADPVRRRELLFVDQPYANHNGGQLAFGPDARLYVGMGDGGSGGDPEDRAQDLSERLGKLLSIDVDGRGRWRIEGYGLRNPWRFSFDRETGDLWIGDVGQGDWEEIDQSPRQSPGLENYGWDVFEGTHSYEDKEPNPAGHLVEPVYEYRHGAGCSVTGGYVYRGSRIPSARGRYFFGDYCSGTVWSLGLSDGDVLDVPRHGRVEALSSFGEDAAGELYVASQNGDVFELVPG